MTTTATTTAAATILTLDWGKDKRVACLSRSADAPACPPGRADCTRSIAKPIAAGGPRELGRGRRHRTRTERAHGQEWLDPAEQTLATRAPTDAALPRRDTIAGVGPRPAAAGGA